MTDRENKQRPTFKAEINEDRIVFLRKQLNYYRQAIKCAKNDKTTSFPETSETPSGRCSVNLCPMLKDVFAHMLECNEGSQCTYSHCPISRHLLRHFVSCSDKRCPVCMTSEKPQQELDDIVRIVYYFNSPKNIMVTHSQPVISFPWNICDSGYISLCDPSELSKLLLPIWKKVDSLKHAETKLPFDEETQNEQQYDCLYVPNPNSLERIKEKLDIYEYKNGIRFAKDMWTLFENFWDVYAMVNNTPDFYYSSLNLALQFQRALDPILMKMGCKKTFSNEMELGIVPPFLQNTSISARYPNEEYDHYLHDTERVVFLRLVLSNLAVIPFSIPFQFFCETLVALLENNDSSLQRQTDTITLLRRFDHSTTEMINHDDLLQIIVNAAQLCYRTQEVRKNTMLISKYCAEMAQHSQLEQTKLVKRRQDFNIIPTTIKKIGEENLWFVDLPTENRVSRIWELMTCLRPDISTSQCDEDELIKFCSKEELDALVRGNDILSYHQLVREKISDFNKKLVQVKKISGISEDDHSLNLDIAKCCFEVL